MVLSVEVAGFSKYYGEFKAVDDLSFSVEPGEIFGLLGPNGAGKTSTFECLEGLREPTAGTLRVMGIDPARDSTGLRKVAGVQLQSAGLPGSMKVGEAMRFFCAYHGIPSRDDLIERFDLTAKIDSQYHELSGGQERRLALALAIAHDPKVLFLDEPTAGLDVQSRVLLHEVMDELRATGTTILLATHDMAEAEKMTNRCAILLKGQLRAVGTPKELTATGGGLTKVSVRSANSVLINGAHEFPAVTRSASEGDYSIYFSTEPGETIAAILAELKGHGDTLVDLRAERPSLEERFLELTTEDAS